MQQLTVELPRAIRTTRSFMINAERTLPDDTEQFGSTLTGRFDGDDDSDSDD